ncbi:BppU family phage baseplate upper protein [Listeria kieliensis]
MGDIYKKMSTTFDVSVNDPSVIKLSGTFSTQDKNTAMLQFVIENEGKPLQFLESAQAVIYLSGNQLKVKKNMEIDRESSTVSYLLTAEEVKHYGRIVGEVYIYYNNDSQQTLSVHKFIFNIDRALIDQELGSIETIYISDFEDIKADYLGRFEKVQVELEIKLDEMGAAIEQLKEDAAEFRAQFEAMNPDQFATKDGGEFTNSLTLNGYDAYTKEKPVQEYLITDSAGKLILKANVDFNNLDASFDTSFMGYLTTSINVPFGLNPNGYFTLRIRTSGYGVATFQPYNSNVVIMNRREGNVNGWRGWAMPTIDTTQVQPLLDKLKEELFSSQESMIQEQVQKTLSDL